MRDVVERPAIKARILFTVQLDNGAGFAVREDDGSQVYMTKTMVFAIKPSIGMSYEAMLIPNAHPTAITPWFAVNLNPETAADLGYLGRVRNALAGGYVCSGEFMFLAEQCEGHPRVWDAMLDAVYVAGECSKFVRFDKPNTPPVRAWYSSDPDSVDVDVWDDEQ